MSSDLLWLFVYDGSVVHDEHVREEYFEAEKHKKTPSARAVTCPICAKKSWNPNDVSERYCGNCHVFWGQAQDAGELDQLKYMIRSGQQ